MKYVQAKAAGKGSSAVLYITAEGKKFIRSGGSRSWRNNNPGNMRLSRFTRDHGAIGSAGGFAVFPTVEIGRDTLAALLRSDSYNTLAISSAINKYAPPQENDTQGYQQLLAKITGLDINMKLNQLNDSDLKAVIDAIQRIEGYTPGIEKAVKKIIGIQKAKGKPVAFLLEGEVGYISRTAAISMAERLEIDAVVVRPVNGTCYLRTRADNISSNNLSAMKETTA